jgi:molecular chaperone DnaK
VERPREPRTPVGLRVKLSYGSVDEFVERFATNISRGGVFIRTRDPKPVGTQVDLELRLSRGDLVVRARGVVRWISEENLAARPPVAPGMGIQFLALDEASRQVIERIVTHRESRGLAPGLASPAPVVDRPTTTPAPTRTAPMAPDPSSEAPLPPHGTPASPAAPPRAPASSAGAPAPPAGGQAPPAVAQAPAAGPQAPAGAPAPPPPAGAAGTPMAAAAPSSAPPSPGPAHADLSAAHRVEQVDRGPVHVDLGLPDEPVPVTRRSRAVIGIDLGTSNSCAAIVKNGRPYVIPSREGYNVVPSMVALNQRLKLIVGHNAKGQLLFNPRNTVYGAKRLVGRSFDEAAVQRILDRFSYEIVAGPGGLCAVRLGPTTLSLEQVQALILREVRSVAQDHVGEDVNRAVITVPAYYSERQREAVRRAGALAGLHVERIVNEPTAAALAYAYGRQVRERVLVYDLGGGTFDASILELENNVYEVVSTGGDTFLGGVDFDARVVERFLLDFEQRHGPFQRDLVALSRLVDAAERAKCALSERAEVPIHLPYLAQAHGVPVTFESRLTREELERLVTPLVDRTLDVCREVLAAKGLGPKDVDEVLLVGGQSRMPLVREKVRAFFGKPPSKSVHPDEAVAIGAALLAHSLGSAEGVVLIDVVPLSIGVGLPGGGGRIKRIIEKNTSLPARKEYTLSTTKDDQRTFDLWVFEGDGATVADCQYLGTIQLSGLPRGPRGSVQIAVTFQLGEECLLTVRARELRSGREVETVFTTKGTPDEVKKRIASESRYAEAGVALPRPPGAAHPPVPDPVAASAEPPAAARGAGLKGLWSRITGR